MRAGVEPTPDWQHSLCEVPILSDKILFSTVLQQLSLCEVVAFCIQVTLSLQTLTLCALKVLESGSGEDLAVFCRSVISYCGKKGVEVKETIIRQKKDPRKYPKLSLFNG